MFLYRIKIKYYSYLEYDECTNAQEHGCEHDCINTLGGYECQCMIGYELHSDEKRCERKCLTMNEEYIFILSQ